jgi:hypothetical protein
MGNQVGGEGPVAKSVSPGILIVGRYIVTNCGDVPNLFSDVQSSVSYVSNVDAESLDNIFEAVNNNDENALQTVLGTSQPYTIAAALKGYLKDLDEPLVPFDNFEPVLSTWVMNLSKNDKSKALALGVEIKKCGPQNVEVMRNMCSMFNALNTGESTKQFAYTFSSSFMRRRDRQTQPKQLVAEAKFCCSIVEHMIAHAPEVFGAIETFESKAPKELPPKPKAAGLPKAAESAPKAAKTATPSGKISTRFKNGGTMDKKDIALFKQAQQAERAEAAAKPTPTPPSHQRNLSSSSNVALSATNSTGSNTIK